MSDQQNTNDPHDHDFGEDRVWCWCGARLASSPVVPVNPEQTTELREQLEGLRVPHPHLTTIQSRLHPEMIDALLPLFEQEANRREAEAVAAQIEKDAAICQRIQDDPQFSESGPGVGVVAAKIVIHAQQQEAER